MTTTFSPLDSELRNEVVLYKISIGVVVCILMIVTVLACTFAYLVFERNPRLRAEYDRKNLISESGKHFSGTEMSRMSNL